MKTHTLILGFLIGTTSLLAPRFAQASELADAVVDSVRAQHQNEVASGEFKATQFVQRQIALANHLDAESRISSIKVSQNNGAPAATAVEASSSTPPTVATVTLPPRPAPPSMGAEINRVVARVDVDKRKARPPVAPRAPVAPATRP